MSKSFALPFVCSLAALITADEAAAAPPKELYGKSIVVSWFETRSQNVRRGGLQSPTISLYVSTAGRIFKRVLVGLGKGRWGFGHGGNLDTSSAEQGPGEGPRGAKVSSTEFAGHSLIMTSVFESGARRVSVEFDDRFTSCQAKVVYGKEAGQSSMRPGSVFGGRTAEVRAIETSGVTCAVREGNVFTEH
jgi:hypothetical protein